MKIWIDLDNSPHVPFFKPIIHELEKRDVSILTTARDAFQVKDLLGELHVEAKLVGRHHGKNKLHKIVGLFIRAIELSPLIFKFRPDLAVSHGSRAQMILAKLLCIKSVMILDYEFIAMIPFFLPDYMIMPEMVSGKKFQEKGIQVIHYPGIKEEVYVPFFAPRADILDLLENHNTDKTIITIREPATEAHYFVPESEKIFDQVMAYLTQRDDVLIILLPRNQRRADQMRSRWQNAYQTKKLVIPNHAVDGLSLLWKSDLVISGGGTMNREAATLGVPVYSIFQGTIGAVDRYLVNNGLLTIIHSQYEAAQQITVQKRSHKRKTLDGRKSAALDSIIQSILSITDAASVTQKIADKRMIQHQAAH